MSACRFRNVRCNMWSDCPIQETIRSLLIKRSNQFLAISRSDLIPWMFLFRPEHDPSDPACCMDGCIRNFITITGSCISNTDVFTTHNLPEKSYRKQVLPFANSFELSSEVSRLHKTVKHGMSKPCFAMSNTVYVRCTGRDALDSRIYITSYVFSYNF